jgi:dTDP-4-amino-4,6-dideoxygalactose transaminase
MDVPDTVRHASKTVVFEQYPVLGFNYRLTDIQAAVGRVQLKRLPGMLERRRELAGRYTRALERIPGLVPPHVPPYAVPNFQSYPVRVTADYPVSRDELMQSLLDRGVGSRRGIMNAHQEGAYADAVNRFPLTRSEEARDSVVLLPLFADMTEAQQSSVIDHLHSLSGLATAPVGVH